MSVTISSLCYVAVVYILCLLPSSLSPLHGLGFYIFLVMAGAFFLVTNGTINVFALVCVILVANGFAVVIIFIIRLVHRSNYRQQIRPPFPWYFQRVLLGQLIITLIPLLTMCYHILSLKYQYELLGLSNFMASYVPHKPWAGIFVFIWYTNVQSAIYGVLYMLRERVDKPGWYAGAIFGRPVYTDYVAKITFLNHFLLLFYLHLFCMLPI